MQSKPNVLLIAIDQWRADSLGCAGHPAAITPNIDRLAARGVRFTNHYAQTAPCGPSRASLLTGTYAHVHRSVGNGTPLDERFTNVALEMATRGYAPTLFGYTDATADVRSIEDPDDPRLRSYEGILPGFHAEVDLTEQLEPWGTWLRAKGYDAPEGAVRDAMYRQRELPESADRGPTWAPAVYEAEHSEAAFLTEEFNSWLGARPHSEPWFAHLTYIRPHPPYFVSEPWNDAVDPADVPMPNRATTVEAEGALHPVIAGALLTDIVTAPDSERDVRQLRATYLGMLAEVDDQLGRALDRLDELGLSDDTIVVLTSDHGDQLADHWLVEKLAFFDESYHIPLIVAGRGVSAPNGSVVDAFTENIDLMPTILRMVDPEADVPAQCQGRDLAPLLAGDVPSDWRTEVFWEWDFRSVGSRDLERTTGLTMSQCNLSVIRDHQAKYVHFAGLPPLFFDLVDDPDETTDRVDDPTQAARVLDYTRRLLSWRQSTDDETLAGTLVTPFGVVSRH
jgi:arylsulfatase A-like enzyme